MQITYFNVTPLLSTVSVPFSKLLDNSSGVSSRAVEEEKNVHAEIVSMEKKKLARQKLIHTLFKFLYKWEPIVC